jgi:predicted RNase H-like HicB family nuclease
MQPSMPDLPLWVYFERDPKLRGIWVAHVLDLDLVTQGDSLADAIDMALDAALTVLAEIIKREPRELADLFAKRRAPQEDWDKLWALFQRAPAQPLELIMRSEADFSAMGTQIHVSAAAVVHRAFGEADGGDGGEPESVQAMPVGAVRKCA